jgi:hypothetical protein
MVVDLEQAKAEGRVAVLEASNRRKYPVSLVIIHGETTLCEAPKDVELLELRMVTRRSTMNPGEGIKLMVILSVPVKELPELTYLKLRSLQLSGSPITWHLPINGETFIGDSYENHVKALGRKSRVKREAQAAIAAENHAKTLGLDKPFFVLNEQGHPVRSNRPLPNFFEN